ncbi:HAD hydrolase family protein, partial [bacterium]|nr:HAD hydrolase family protein [bacterium]
GVSMENGYEEVKKAATYITASNEDSGVAKALNQFVNIK